MGAKECSAHHGKQTACNAMKDAHGKEMCVYENEKKKCLPKTKEVVDSRQPPASEPPTEPPTKCVRYCLGIAEFHERRETRI